MVTLNRSHFLSLVGSAIIAAVALAIAFTAWAAPALERFVIETWTINLPRVLPRQITHALSMHRISYRADALRTSIYRLRRDTRVVAFA